MRASPSAELAKQRQPIFWRIAGAGAYDLAASHVTNIDALVLSKNAAGSSIVVGDSVVSTADFNKDGVGGDLQISKFPVRRGHHDASTSPDRTISSSTA